MRERRKQHKLNKSAEQTNSQQKKGFNSNLDTLPLSTQEPKAQEEETQTNKQTNKHANRDLESNLKKKKSLHIHLHFKTPWQAQYFLSCFAQKSCSVRTTTLMCLARSLELPIKKSENAVCRKRKHHLHHSLTVISINVAVKAGVCN